MYGPGLSQQNEGKYFQKGRAGRIKTIQERRGEKIKRIRQADIKLSEPTRSI